MSYNRQTGPVEVVPCSTCPKTFARSLVVAATKRPGQCPTCRQRARLKRSRGLAPTEMHPFSITPSQQANAQVASRRSFTQKAMIQRATKAVRKVARVVTRPKLSGKGKDKPCDTCGGDFYGTFEITTCCPCALKTISAYQRTA